MQQIQIQLPHKINISSPFVSTALQPLTLTYSHQPQNNLINNNSSKNLHNNDQNSKNNHVNGNKPLNPHTTYPQNYSNLNRSNLPIYIEVQQPYMNHQNQNQTQNNQIPLNIQQQHQVQRQQTFPLKNQNQNNISQSVPISNSSKQFPSAKTLTESRPKSPSGIRFQYVSPSKNKLQKELKQQSTNRQVFSVGIENVVSQKQVLFTQKNNLNNQTNQNHPSITNYIYQIDHQQNNFVKQLEDEVKNSLGLQVKKTQSVENKQPILRDYEQKQYLDQIQHEIQENRKEQNYEKLEKYENEQKQQNIQQKVPNRNDDYLKQMIQQYEKLKQIYNDDQQPRVDKNSSDQNDDEDGSRRNSRRFSNLTSQGSRRMSNLGNQRLQKGSNNKKVNEGFKIKGQQQIVQQIIEQPLEISLREQVSKTKNAQTKKQNQYAIREDQVFVISGVDNIQSEVVENVIFPSQSSMKQNENKEYLDEQDRTLLKEKDIEIKNLRNQLLIMKMRQKQMLSIIKRLQKTNKTQFETINLLKKIKQ